MDLFGDDEMSGSEDENVTTENFEESNRKVVNVFLNVVFVELMVLKSQHKGSVGSVKKLLDFYVSIFCDSALALEQAKEFQAKLLFTQFFQVNIRNYESFCANDLAPVDIVIFINTSKNNSSPEKLSKYNFLHNNLIPGGLLFENYFFLDSPQDEEKLKLFFSQNKWNVLSMKTLPINQTKNNTFNAISIRTRLVHNNKLAANYWKIINSNDLEVDNLKCLENNNIEVDEDEIRLLDDITVSCSCSERQNSFLSSPSQTKAINALKNHGLCILRGIFPPQLIMKWGEAALSDLQAAMNKLLEKNIDLNRPGEGAFINNFHELSMREARRCDLRNGTSMKLLAQHIQMGNSNLDDDNNNNDTLPTLPQNIPRVDLRTNPSILEVLNQVMNPLGDPEDSKGNWGRWNFNGGGPQAGPPPLAYGQVGAIMTLPGCEDQTIHADTAHLYVHTQLPAHYINMFSPALLIEKGMDSSVGQTAFVAGSHVLSVSSRIMAQPGGEVELSKRLVRPQLIAGDVLLFDCRVLHFGLGNHSHDVIRPMVYVNYHQQWFVDPKNWNDAEKLFP